MRGAFFEDGRPVAAVDADVYFDEKETSAEDAFEMAREILKIIVGSQNPGFQAEVLALLLGVGFRGCSEQEIATRNGCTRAAVSARLMKLRDRMGIDRPVGPMRQDSTRRECERSRLLAAMR
jgi:hypothetical protein